MAIRLQQRREVIDRQKLRAFLADFRSHTAALEKRSCGHSNPAVLGPLIGRLHEKFTEARDSGVTLNPWTVSGLKTDEVRNCAVLACLIDHRQLGATARRFLAAILARVPHASRRYFPTADIEAGSYIVRCETCVAGDWSNRVDILIESPGSQGGWIIALEAKIRAGLGRSQLEDYHTDLRRRADMTDRRAFLIYLAPFEPLGIEPRVRRDLGHIRWADIRDAAGKAMADCTTIEARARYLIGAFRDHIADFD